MMKLTLWAIAFGAVIFVAEKLGEIVRATL